MSKERALSLFDLYGKTEQDLGMKLHHTIGNHDMLGVYPQSGLSPADPLYGKKLFEEHFGKTYYSFDHKGVHFVVLDSIRITADRAYEGRVDDVQLQWLAADLKALPAGTPIIVAVHIPLVTAFLSYVPEVTSVAADAPPTATHHGSSVAMPAPCWRSLPAIMYSACCRAIPTSASVWSGKGSVHHQRRRLRELVAWHADGNAGELYGGHGCGWKADDALRDVRRCERSSAEYVGGQVGRKARQRQGTAGTRKK